MADATPPQVQPAPADKARVVAAAEAGKAA